MNVTGMDMVIRISNELLWYLLIIHSFSLVFYLLYWGYTTFPTLFQLYHVGILRLLGRHTSTRLINVAWPRALNHDRTPRLGIKSPTINTRPRRIFTRNTTQGYLHSITTRLKEKLPVLPCLTIQKYTAIYRTFLKPCIANLRNVQSQIRLREWHTVWL